MQCLCAGRRTPQHNHGSEPTRRCRGPRAGIAMGGQCPITGGKAAGSEPTRKRLLDDPLASALVQAVNAVLGKRSKPATFDALPTDFTDGKEDRGCKPRHSYNQKKAEDMGREAVWFRTHRPDCAAERQRPYRWKHQYLTWKYGTVGAEEMKQHLNTLRSGLRAYRCGAPLADPKKVHEERATCRRGVPAQSRHRHSGGGRQLGAPELMRELWYCFCERLRANRSRVGTLEIIEMAEIIKRDLRSIYTSMVHCGELPPYDIPRFPKLDENVVRRWRFRFQVTVRTINVRFKVSEKVFRERLRVFWCNCIRLRTLCKLLAGSEPAFVGYDQTPSWFNSTATQKTHV